ncbi:MAG: S9 family peptidase, partial [Chitinophagaceae bacterium]
MLQKNTLLALLFLFAAAPAICQDDISYKMPPKEIAEMLLVKPTPGVNINDKGEWMLLTESSSYPSVEEMAKPEYRIAGLRLNPNNFAPSRQNYITNLSLKNIATGKTLTISGLPVPLYAGAISWSPDEKKIAFTNTTANRVDLYSIEVLTQKATKLNRSPLNTITGSYTWYDNNSIIYRAAINPVSAAPKKPLAPKGPAVQENYGKASPRPTYQDMIKSPFDETVFAFYATTQLVKNTNGVETKIGPPAIYLSASVSPDKKYLLLRTA